MYNNVLQGVGNGQLVSTYKLPRFPKASELSRLASGITFDRLYNCQAAASPLAEDVVGGAGRDAIAYGTVGYKQSATNTLEIGAKTTPVNGGWSAGIAVNAGANSFMLGAYFDYDDTGSAVFNTVGLWTAGNSSPWAYIGARTAGYTLYFYDGVNSKVIAIAGGDCRDKRSRGIIVLYDAGAGNIYTVMTGKVGVQVDAMGVWTGIGASTSPVLGGVTGFTGYGGTLRQGFIASGAQLDNWNTNLSAFHRRLGWQ